MNLRLMCQGTPELFPIDQPSPELVHLSTVVRTLPRMGRGNCLWKHNFTVAQHSLLHRYQCELLGYPERVCALGLVHDGHETYTGDMPTQIKMLLGEGWKRFEAAWANAFRERFGITGREWAQHRDAIKRVDKEVLVIELALFSGDDPDAIAKRYPDHWKNSRLHLEAWEYAKQLAGMNEQEVRMQFHNTLLHSFPELVWS